MLSSTRINQSKFPMIIAMKGPSSSKKSEIARKLAAFLQHPLIDEEDIISTSSNESNLSINNYLLFKIITQISSTQLDSKLGVIICTPLSQRTQLENLARLASSKEASLIIIDCESQRNKGFDDGVPKLSIDTTKTFVVEDFVSKMLDLHKKVYPRALKAHQSKGLSIEKVHNNNINNNNNNNKIVDTIYAQKHVHEFSFIEKAKLGGFDALNCNYCMKSISSDAYKCIECNEFILHKECGESRESIYDLHEKCPPYLKQNPPKYDFPQKHKCTHCEHFSEHCVDCLFQTHIKCAFLPTILQFGEHHHHRLTFVIMPLWFNFEYKCIRCNKLGNYVSYKCFLCNFDFHINCAIPIPLGKHQLRELFKKFDMDGDGRLSLEEVKIAFTNLGSRWPAFRVFNAFKLADANRDGSINLNDHELDALVDYAYKSLSSGIPT